jgi:hypothetical protein
MPAKAIEVRSLVAIAAQKGAKTYKSDTSQAFLYGDIDQDLYHDARTPDWWPELVPAAADEELEYLRGSTGGQGLACALIDLGGGALIPPCQQREDNLYDGKRMASSSLSMECLSMTSRLSQPLRSSRISSNFISRLPL